MANLLFKDCTTGELVYPDTLVQMNRIYSKFPAGTYDAILLYNNGKYLKHDALTIQSYTYLDVDMDLCLYTERSSVVSRVALAGKRNWQDRYKLSWSQGNEDQAVCTQLRR